jgi:gliding motility-associated-like protein
LPGAAANGCDSTINIQLQFFPAVTFTLRDTICESDSLIVNGNIYNRIRPNGTETIRGAAANGCDSTINIQLQFFPAVTFTLRDTICESDSLIVNGNIYNRNRPTGTETLPGAAANGCDSTINIQLQFFPAVTFTLRDTICESDSLIVNGNIYNRNRPTGTETLPGAAANDCDSTINIQLQFFPAVTSTLRDTICESDSLIVNGNVYNQTRPTGTETIRGAAANGCDSTINIQLQFFPAEIFVLQDTLCEGDSLTVNGTVYNQARPSGTEVLRGVSRNGCDSTISIQLTFLEIVRIRIDSTLCTGDSLRVNGNIYNASNPIGTETLRGAARNGCDSVITINLRFVPSATFTLNNTLCQNDSLIINGSVYNRTRPSGTETLRRASVTGCDSIITINLQFLPAITSNLDSSLCEGESLTVNGRVYNQANPRGTERLRSASGCDSIVNVNLRFVPPARFNLTRTICEADSVVVNGRVYNRARPSGTEILLGVSSTGCDSIVTVQLQFFPVAVGNLIQTLCQGDSLTVNGRIYNQANPRGAEILPNASTNGCDSTVNINLTFLPAVRRSLDTLLCPGESLTVNGKTYHQNNPVGTEIFRAATASGCDSIVQINLRFRPAVSGSVVGNDTICAGDSTTLTFRLGGAPTFDVRYSDGTNSFALNGISDGHTVRVAPVRTTTYTITFIAINGAACPAQISGSASVQVSNLAALATVVTNYAGFGVSCFGAKDGTVQAEGSNGAAPLTYRWNTNETTQQVPGAAAGLYQVTVTDAAGCTASDSVTVTEPQEIVVSSSTRSPGCVEQKTGVIVLDSIQGGAAPFEVSLNGTSYRAVSGFPYELTNLAAGNYEVFVRDANDCQTSFKTNISAPSAPVVDLGADITLRLGDSVELVGLANFIPTKIEWQPDTFLTTPNALRTFVSVTETTTYRLTVSDTTGCKATDQITVFLDRARGVYIPTAFTPDGDGVNDFFFINGGNDVRRIRELLIFDRWGNLLFQRGELQPNDPQLGWDGTFNGKKVSLGVYVYYAAIEFVDGRTEIFEGDITVVR